MSNSKCVGCKLREEKVKTLESEIAYLKHELANKSAEAAAAVRVLERGSNAK